MTIQNRPYSAGHFELEIDGHKTTTYLKSVDGGWAKANVTDDPHGATSDRVKQLATVEYEPITIEFGLSGAAKLLKWVQGSWNRQWDRRSGQINHADFNLKTTFEHWFYDALIVETTFPTLDGSSKDPGYIKCKIQPERANLVQSPAPTTLDQRSTGSGKQRMWTPSAFRFTLDQVDGMEYTNKIESFTIKQGVKKLYVGAERFPQLSPTKVEFPNLSGTIALAHAGKLLKWHDDYISKIANGRRDPASQLSGAIEFLSPDRASTVFRIVLSEVGLTSATIQQSTANTDQLKRVKFDMFIGKMELDGAGALGLD